MKDYNTLADALSDLKQKGYEADFETTTDCLYCGDLDIRLNPEEFKIDEVHSFKADPTTDNSSILYAISSLGGVKGTLVDPHGTYLENLNIEKTWEMNRDSSKQV